MLLIRHLASEIRIFAYFKNLTLIGAFLGLGIGYLFKPKVNLLVTVTCVLFLAVITHPTTGFQHISNFLILNYSPNPSGPISTMTFLTGTLKGLRMSLSWVPEGETMSLLPFVMGSLV